jgi:hypothetical protein
MLGLLVERLHNVTQGAQTLVDVLRLLHRGTGGTALYAQETKTIYSDSTSVTLGTRYRNPVKNNRTTIDSTQLAFF